MDQKKKLFEDNSTLRMIGAHPSVLREHNSSTKSISKEWWEDLCPDVVMNDVHSSGKMTVLLSILSECAAKNDKLVVFSQSKATLTSIEHFLHPEVRRGIHSFRIDGETKAKDRKEICDTFSSSEQARHDKRSLFRLNIFNILMMISLSE